MSKEAEQMFGDYIITMQEEGHAVIRRADGDPVNPTFYEMQHMKNIAFGGDGNAIEVFPPQRRLVDGQNQRHLWAIDYETVPHIEIDDELHIN